jgi:hypothetical protein
MSTEIQLKNPICKFPLIGAWNMWKKQLSRPSGVKSSLTTKLRTMLIAHFIRNITVKYSITNYHHYWIAHGLIVEEINASYVVFSTSSSPSNSHNKYATHPVPSSTRSSSQLLICYDSQCVFVYLTYPHSNIVVTNIILDKCVNTSFQVNHTAKQSQLILLYVPRKKDKQLHHLWEPPMERK